MACGAASPVWRKRRRCGPAGYSTAGVCLFARLLRPPYYLVSESSGLSALADALQRPEAPHSGSAFVNASRGLVPLGPSPLWALALARPPPPSQPCSLGGGMCSFRQRSWWRPRCPKSWRAAEPEQAAMGRCDTRVVAQGIVGCMEEWRTSVLGPCANHFTTPASLLCSCTRPVHAATCCHAVHSTYHTT